MSAAREEILGRVREALGRRAGMPPATVPATARIAPRVPAAPDAEIEQFLSEVRKLSGVAQRLPNRDALAGVALGRAAQHAVDLLTPVPDATKCCRRQRQHAVLDELAGIVDEAA